MAKFRPIRKPRGFTLIELMIVIFMILILVSVAAPMYTVSVTRARETVLKQNLYNLRMAIDQYTYDKMKAPQTLDDLVNAGYFREIPLDPITNSRETWTVDQEEILTSIDQTETGISNVHSGASGSGLDGTPYSSW